MRVTILVSDNTVIVDGRPLPIDCSAISPYIRVMNWWDTHGEIEFYNEPGKEFLRNGKLDSLSEFRDAIEAWQILAQKIDNVPRTRMKSGFEINLNTMPAHEAGRVLKKIESDPTLKAMPLNAAVDKLCKIELDPDLKHAPLGEAIRIMDKIKSEPKLNERHPGPAVRELRAIEADPDLKHLPVHEALESLGVKEDEHGPPPPKQPVDKGAHTAPKPPPGGPK